MQAMFESSKDEEQSRRVHASVPGLEVFWLRGEADEAEKAPKKHKIRVAQGESCVLNIQKKMHMLRFIVVTIPKTFKSITS